jgi:hypothetical protein
MVWLNNQRRRHRARCFPLNAAIAPNNQYRNKDVTFRNEARWSRAINIGQVQIEQNRIDLIML